jgi:hypothetical protein
MKKFICVCVLFVLASGCAGWMKTAACSAKAAAEMLCCMTASEQPEEALEGLTPEAFCAKPENFAPFLAAAEAAQEEASAKVGLPKK